MARNDWAIVVGIRDYFDADLHGLQGPENDARAFHEWVTAPDGGGVPKKQAQLILSSMFQEPAPEKAENAMPTALAIRAAFDHLHAIAAENEENEIGREVGRRLYLFFAGHGFAPSHRDDLTALITADASIHEARLSHVLASEFADWFYRARFFEEIFLFVDCCRSIMECAQLFESWPVERGRDFHQVRRFYAYGARVAMESREWTPEGRECHGVFTMTLLDALRGGAQDPDDPAVITAESLRDHLYNAFAANMVPADRERPDVPKEPEVVYESRPGPKLEIAGVPRALRKKLRYPVEITAPASAVGKKVRVLDGSFELATEATLTEMTALELARGLYVLEVPELAVQKPFQVPGGIEVVRVSV